MTDAKMTVYDYGGDVIYGANDLVPDNGLYTAVLISLFSDARAPAGSELPQNEVSRRGVWHDTDLEVTGCLLWLIGRETTAEVRRVPARAREAAENGLAWMVDKGIAATVVVDATIQGNTGLQLLIEITRGTAREYQYLWDGVRESEQIQFGNTSIQLKFNR